MPLPRRERNTFILLVFLFFLYSRYSVDFTFEEGVDREEGEGAGAGGGGGGGRTVKKEEENVFTQFINTKKDDKTVESVDEAFRDMCFIRDEVLACRFDKLCAGESSFQCANKIGDMVVMYNPKGLRLAVGELSYDLGGEILDLFLAPRSTWSITSEPFDHSPTKEFILKQMPSSSIEYKFYTTLNRQQFPSQCDKMWVQKYTSVGFGLTVGYLSYGLTVGYETGTTFIGILNQNEIWPYFRNCPKADWSCFFLPYTNCTPPSSPEYKTDKDSLLIIPHDVVPEPFNTLTSSSGMPNSLLWWRMHLMNYLLRPTYTTRKQTSLMESNLYNNTGGVSSKFHLNFPCVTIHVRHGDTWIEPGRRKFFNLTHYISAARPLLKMLEGNNIFLVFDDALLEEEIQEFQEFQFSYLPRIRRKGKSPPYHMFEGDPNEELYWILILMKIAGSCSAFIGAFSSNFSALVYQSMCALNEVCPLFASLDDPVWHVLY